MKLLGEHAAVARDAASEKPFVSMVLPLFNGAQYLRDCVDHVAGLDYPRTRIELLVIDGRSSDGSAKLATRLLDEHGLAGSVIENPGRTIASNLNVGLEHASGSLVCRIDVKSRVPKSYLQDATNLLATYPDMSWVGGGIIALPSNAGHMALGIARAHNNPVVMGGARYRNRQVSGGAETVYLGVGRIEALRAVGGWGTDLEMNEDYDLCQRLGGVDAVWFDDRLTAGWAAPGRASTLIDRYHGFGRSKVKYWRARRTGPAPRQIALLSSPLPLFGLAGAALRRGSTPTFLGTSTVVALGGLLAIDNAFGPSDFASVRERLASALVAAPLIGGGWLSGVLRETLLPGSDE